MHFSRAIDPVTGLLAMHAAPLVQRFFEKAKALFGKIAHGHSDLVNKQVKIINKFRAKSDK